MRRLRRPFHAGSFRVLSLFLVLFACLPQPGLASSNPKGIGLETLSVEEILSHLQTRAGSAVLLPEVRVKGTLRLFPRLGLFLQHYRGTSQVVNGFQASVGDFESRLLYRLDDPQSRITSDSPFHNVHVWVSWDIWTLTHHLNGATFQERDEGGGFGITRKPSRKGLSYWYSFGIYPSVRTPIGQEDDSLLAEAGGVYNVSEGLAVTAGYSVRTFRTSRDARSRAEEQGILFGLRGSF